MPRKLINDDKLEMMRTGITELLKKLDLFDEEESIFVRGLVINKKIKDQPGPGSLIECVIIDGGIWCPPGRVIMPVPLRTTVREWFDKEEFEFADGIETDKEEITRINELDLI